MEEFSRSEHIASEGKKCNPTYRGMSRCDVAMPSLAGLGPSVASVNVHAALCLRFALIICDAFVERLSRLTYSQLSETVHRIRSTSDTDGHSSQRPRTASRTPCNTSVIRQDAVADRIRHARHSCSSKTTTTTTTSNSSGGLVHQTLRSDAKSPTHPPPRIAPGSRKHIGGHLPPRKLGVPIPAANRGVAYRRL